MNVPMALRVQRTAFVTALSAGLLGWATAIALGSRMLASPDVASHIAVGRWILAHREIPVRDPFSHTMPGAPWVAHEWLVETVMALVYDHLGWAALVGLFALCFALALGLLAAALLNWLSPSGAAIAVLGAWGMCLFHLQARPHVTVLPLVVVWTASLVVAREEERTPSCWLVLVLWLWANLHGSLIFGLILALLFAGEALLYSPDWQQARRVAKSWVPFLLMSAAATLTTPNGVSGLLFPIQVQRMTYALSWINEWQQPNFQHGHVTEAWLLAVLLGALTFGVRLPITRTLMLLVLVHMALVQQRHAELLGLCAPLIAAPALDRWFRRPAEPGQDVPGQDMDLRKVFEARTIGPFWGNGLIAGALTLAIAAGLWRLPTVAPPPTADYSQAIAMIRGAGISGNVFNSYDVGGHLMLAGISPFIDGRLDMYGEPLLRRYNDIANLRKLVSDYNVRWTLFRHGEAQVDALDHLPGWRRLYSDQYSVVHVRED